MRAIPCNVAFPFMVNFALPEEAKNANMADAQCRLIMAVRFSENDANEVFYIDGIQVFDDTKCYTVEIPGLFISPKFMTDDVVNDLGKYRCATLTDEPFWPETVYSKLKDGPATINEKMWYHGDDYLIFFHAPGEFGRDCDLRQTKFETDLCSDEWLNVQTDPMVENKRGYPQFIYWE